MRILAKIQELRDVTAAEFWIDCGLGNQFISWLGTTACLKFGQVHYPKGIYIPYLVHREGQADDWPHPR